MNPWVYVLVFVVGLMAIVKFYFWLTKPNEKKPVQLIKQPPQPVIEASADEKVETEADTEDDQEEDDDTDDIETVFRIRLMQGDRVLESWTVESEEDYTLGDRSINIQLSDDSLESDERLTVVVLLADQQHLVIREEIVENPTAAKKSE